MSRHCSGGGERSNGRQDIQTFFACTPYCSPLIVIRVVHLFKSILYCILNCTVLFYSVLYSSIANKYRTEGDLRDGHTSSDGERDC
jgi:hypothetical protein